MRLVKKYPIINVFHHTLFTYPAPSNLTYLWNFGSLALICLAIQIITGIFLAMHYVPNADLAFSSVEHIMRDVNFGWLLRYLHANGASMFFLVVYFHIFRGLYYGSFSKPRELLWCTGVIILLLMILTAFLGYVLPWGQMSFWAATVITNLASAIPFGIGDFVVSWLWGGFSVGNATLNRFFSLHYLFPFIILALAFIHLILLHENGSNNPLGIGFKSDNISFGPYFLVKDLFGFVVFLFIYFFFLYFFPNYLGHSDNYIPANPLVTPAHIVPEWYFLPFYAILRSVPDKLLGVLLLLGAIFILLLLPFFIKITVRSNIFKPVTKFFFWFFLVDCLILGWIGGKPIESPFLEIGKFATLFYFYYFLLILPFLKFFENIIFFNQISMNIVKNKIGALTSKPYAFQARPWELLSIESFDIFDSFGSTIRIDLRGSKILRILPKFSNINQQWISDRIRFSYDSLNFQKILSPFFKNVDNILVSCSWEYSFLFLKKIFLSVNSSKQLLFKFGSLSDFLSIIFFKKFLNFFGSNNFCNQKNSDFRNLNIHFFSLNFDSLCLLGLNLRIESPILNLRLKKQFINKFIFLFGTSSYNLNFFYYFLGFSSFSFFNFFLGRSFFSFLFYLKKNLFFIGVDFNLNLIFLEKLKSIFINSLFIFWNNSISKNNLSEISISSINSFINFNIKNIYYLYHIDFFSSYFLNNNFLIFQGYQGDSFLSNFNLILPSLSFFEQSLFFINNLNDFFKLDVCLKSGSTTYTNLKFIHLLFKTKFFYICLNFFFGLWFFHTSKKLSSFYFLYSFSLLFLVNNQIIYQFFNNFYITNLWTKNSLNLSTASKLYFKKKLHYNEHAN